MDIVVLFLHKETSHCSLFETKQINELCRVLLVGDNFRITLDQEKATSRIMHGQGKECVTTSQELTSVIEGALERVGGDARPLAVEDVVLSALGEGRRHVLTVVRVLAREALRRLHAVVARLADPDAEQVALTRVPVRADEVAASEEQSVLTFSLTSVCCANASH